MVKEKSASEILKETKAIVKKFSFDTIDEFDTHIATSIPNYLLIHDIILGLSEYFLDDNTNVYDLGCSKGTLIRKMSERFKAKKIHYYGIDVSENLLPKSDGDLTYLMRDITDEKLHFENASLILSIFTLQFLKQKERVKMLKKIYDGLNKGGAFIITEKIYAANALTQDIFTFLYYDFKKRTFTNEEIMSKETDLRRLMHPLDYEDNIKMLREAGFTKIEPFYKFYNFVGFICIK